MCFLFPSLCYAIQLRKLSTSLLKTFSPLLFIDKRIKHSPFYRHPTMTCKISCLWSEKSENAVQRGHRCPHTYLSGQFLKVHLQKYTKKKNPFFEVYSQTNNTNNFRNSEAGKRSMSLHYQVWLQHLQKLCEEYEQILQQTCCSSTLTLHHLQNQTVALYRPTQKEKKKKHNDNAMNFEP